MDVHGGLEKAMSTLKHKVISGVKWSAVSQVGRQVTQLLTTVLLARLLLPSEFGLLAMAMVVIGFINIFKDLGTSAAVIQQKELSQLLLSSIFWINVGFGLIATMILFLLAPLGAAYYQEPRVTIVLQVLAPSFFISGLGILHQALLERTISFDSLAKLELVSVIVGAIAGVSLALLKAGVWSLVFQSLATSLLTTILLWQSSSWRPKWIFHWKEVKAVSRFGLNLTGFSIFNYFARNADYLLIGRYLGAQELGYYTLAYRILLFPIQNISAVIGRVMYPVLSTMQDNNESFISAYLKIIQYISLITFPMMMGLWVISQPFILAFFGEKWRPVILLIEIFAPVGLVQSIGTTVGAIYQAKARTDWMFRWGLGSGMFVVTAFIIGLRWGIVGVAAAYAIVTFIILYPSFTIPFRLIGLKFFQMLIVLAPSLFNSSLMLLAILMLKMTLFTSLSNTSVLILSLIIGSAIYVAMTLLTNRKQVRELWSLTGWNKGKLHETG